MRARAGDLPRTMAQKILAGRSADPSLAGDTVVAKVDQVVVARAPERGLEEAVAQGLRRTPVETAVVYDGLCVTPGVGPSAERAASSLALHDAVGYGILLARPGAGFPLPVHLERFASPGRLCVTDEPRLAGAGGAGMLTWTLPTPLLARALVTGSVPLRVPRSIQVQVSGRLRPFVAARDVGLELLRRGLGEKVQRLDALHRAPVVVEMVGPGVRLLSVTERAVVAGIAPALGAAAVLFTSDERTEVFLRDERRSKAHRALAPDAGAPFDDVLAVDLGAVDPLLQDEQGAVRPVRDLAGKPVAQVLLGGDGGVTLRDLLATAALLKSKRVPPRLDLLVAPPSRQALEVLATEGAVADLAAAGARFVEPDVRLLTQELYGPPGHGLALRTCDAEPRGGVARPLVASAETAAYAVAQGEVGDPRAWKRPVRVTVPRTLPTEDVLLLRERRESKASKVSKAEAKGTAPSVRAPAPFRGGEVLRMETAARVLAAPSAAGPMAGPMTGAAPTVAGSLAASVAARARGLDDLRALLLHVATARAPVAAIVSPHWPSPLAAYASGLGVVALEVNEEGWAALEALTTVHVPPLATWPEGREARLGAGENAPVALWVARGDERMWVEAGLPRPAATARRS